jgi:hypothetical protein
VASVEISGQRRLTAKFNHLQKPATSCKILESLAAGIRSGAIPVPGRTKTPQQTTPTTDYRQLAAAMDRRMRQLAEEGVPR